MRPEAACGLVITRVGIGSVQATYGQTLNLRLQLEGAWVAFQVERLNTEHARNVRYQTRFPVHVLHGEACVGRALIKLYEAPSLTSSDLPLVDDLDTAFTQIFQAFLRLNEHQLIHIAWDWLTQNEVEPQQLSHAADARMAA